MLWRWHLGDAKARVVYGLDGEMGSERCAAVSERPRFEERRPPSRTFRPQPATEMVTALLLLRCLQSSRREVEQVLVSTMPLLRLRLTCTRVYSMYYQRKCLSFQMARTRVAFVPR